MGTMAVEMKRQNSQPESIQAWQICWRYMYCIMQVSRQDSD